MLYVAGHTYAQFYRGGRQSSNEMRLVKQWRPELIAIGDQEGKLAGLLLARTGGANTMDALVVAAAARHAITEILPPIRTISSDSVESSRRARFPSYRSSTAQRANPRMFRPDGGQGIQRGVKDVAARPARNSDSGRDSADPERSAPPPPLRAYVTRPAPSEARTSVIAGRRP